jgi:hypothetical protein
MPGNSDSAKLAKCMRDAKNDADRQACEAQFVADGGTVEGGKVFLDAKGGATFVTKGGKVFGGKVF